MSQTFLSTQEIAELTGVLTGKDRKTREQLQVDALKKMKIPHYVNARGRPIVARAIIEGGSAKPADKPTGWEPAFA